MPAIRTIFEITPASKFQLPSIFTIASMSENPAFDGKFRKSKNALFLTLIIYLFNLAKTNPAIKICKKPPIDQLTTIGRETGKLE